ncbi:MAG TPA: hypothetical protein VK623_06930 [Flavobacterium sp.]|nr:hypothetical protein [Flavobacterium sp.]
MLQQKISILGCGWLGQPLAEAFLKNGNAVKGSTTSENKLPLLKNSGIEPYLIALSANGIAGNIIEFLANSNILIIDIPPKLRSENSESFGGKIKMLVPFVENSGIKKVLFISSTAVYADGDSVVTEETIANPETESGKQLIESEKLLQDNPNFETTILRFGGLVGENRHPVNFLAGKENLENPDAPINLIHGNDCIGIILEIIKKNAWNNIFNAAFPFHPTREIYYVQKAIDLKLALPKFDHSKKSKGKIIDSKKLIDTLDYQFSTLP